MHIVGIAGVSGSGKSTFGKRLAKSLPKSKHVDGDVFQYKSFDVFRQDARRLFQDDFTEECEKPLFSWVINGEEKGYEFVELIRPYINDSLHIEAEYASIEGYEFLIVEWQALTILDFWNICDIKIVIESDITKRSEMLQKRKIHGCSADSAKKRTEFFEFAFTNLDEETIRIFNDYEMDSIALKLEPIITKISKMSSQKALHNMHHNLFQNLSRKL